MDLYVVKLLKIKKYNERIGFYYSQNQTEHFDLAAGFFITAFGLRNEFGTGI